MSAAGAMTRPLLGSTGWREWARRHHQPKAWQTNLALLLIGLALVFFSHQFLAESDEFWIGFSGCSAASAVLYLVACWLVLTKPVDRWTFPLVVTVACACRLITLFGEPFLSSDIYRYVWDGVVQHAHISPYRYVPGDPALSFLRQPNLEAFNNMNRRDYARTIYPPAAQFFFYLVTYFSPTVTCMKTFMVLCEGATAWGLVKLLRGLGYRREQLLLYAWCPMLVWEIGGSGHLDAVAIMLITLALLARFRNHPILTGLLLGLAVITKMYPLVLFPALYRRGGDPKPEWKMPAAMAGIMVFGYACYSSVGKLVFGFLTDYTKEEGMQSGARYFLLEWAQRLPGLQHLPLAVYYAFCTAIFAILSMWAWRAGNATQTASSPRCPVKPFRLGRADFIGRDGSFLAPAFGLALALMLLFSPHYAWYIAWLFPFFALMPSLPAAVYLMGFFYGYTTWLADPGPKMFLLNERLYSATLAAFALHLALKAWPAYRANFLASPAPPRDPMHSWES